MSNHDKTFGSGFVWLVSSIFLVILPTAFSYVFRCISEEKIIKISEFYDSILLILFSISCSLAALCFDIRSKLINKLYKQFVIILSSLCAIFYGLFYFYLYGMSNPKKSNLILNLSFFLIFLFGILGFTIANQHNEYDQYIKNAQKNIANQKSNP